MRCPRRTSGGTAASDSMDRKTVRAGTSKARKGFRFDRFLAQTMESYDMTQTDAHDTPTKAADDAYVRLDPARGANAASGSGRALPRQFDRKVGSEWATSAFDSRLFLVDRACTRLVAAAH